MGRPFDAGISPQDRPLPAGTGRPEPPAPSAPALRTRPAIQADARGLTNRSTEKKGSDSSSKGLSGKPLQRLADFVSPSSKGLWVYRSDEKIGRYRDSSLWKAMEIPATKDGVKENGFVGVVAAVKKYFEESKNKKVHLLGIVVHGNEGGLVEFANATKDIPKEKDDKQNCEDMDRYKYLSPYTIKSFKNTISALDPYLTDDAYVVFFSCVAGGGPNGDYLLSTMSDYLGGKKTVEKITIGGKTIEKITYEKDRTVVGFATKADSGVSSDKSWLQEKEAGAVLETGEPFSDPNRKPGDKLPLREIDSPYAKQARGGKIVKRPSSPPSEQTVVNFRPTRTSYIRRDFFDLLFPNKYFYYLAILLIGFRDLEKGSSGDKYREGMNLIEGSDEFVKLQKEGLPEESEAKDGVYRVWKTEVRGESKILDKKRKAQYYGLKATLKKFYQDKEEMPFIWQNSSSSKRRAYIETMLQLSSGQKPAPSLLKTIGSQEARSHFNLK